MDRRRPGAHQRRPLAASSESWRRRVAERHLGRLWHWNWIRMLRAVMTVGVEEEDAGVDLPGPLRFRPLPPRRSM